jgi:hypothetical protein
MEIPARAIHSYNSAVARATPLASVPPTISTRPSIHQARGILMMSSHILQGSDGQSGYRDLKNISMNCRSGVHKRVW